MNKIKIEDVRKYLRGLVIFSRKYGGLREVF